MSARRRHHQERRLRIRSIRKDPPDLRKLASALIALAQAQMEAEAQAEHEAKPVVKVEGERENRPRKGAA